MKRVFDVFVSLIGLLIFSPVIVMVAILVRISFGTPVIFQQERPGIHTRPFMLFKFRTMTNEVGPDGILLPNEQRHTRFGQFLRSTSLDELPSLLNVIRGDMSLVGPRPLRTWYVEKYKGDQIRRHEVRPGITGWAQVNGRNHLTFTERFIMDVWYVDNRSFFLDTKILAMTFLKVFRRDGIVSKNNVMAPFDGTN